MRICGLVSFNRNYFKIIYIYTFLPFTCWTGRVVDADLDVSLLVLDEVVLDLVEVVLAAVLVVWVPGAVLPVADLELEQSVEKESRQ